MRAAKWRRLERADAQAAPGGRTASRQRAAAGPMTATRRTLPRGTKTRSARTENRGLAIHGHFDEPVRHAYQALAQVTLSGPHAARGEQPAGDLIAETADFLLEGRLGQRSVLPHVPPFNAHQQHHPKPPAPARNADLGVEQANRGSGGHAVLDAVARADQSAAGAADCRSGSTSRRRPYSVGAPVMSLKGPTRKIAERTLPLRRAAGRSRR
jgi:hypothetical protein